MKKLKQERLDNIIAEILDDRTPAVLGFEGECFRNDQVSSKPVILSRVWAKDLPGCLRLTFTYEALWPMPGGFGEGAISAAFQSEIFREILRQNADSG